MRRLASARCPVPECVGTAPRPADASTLRPIQRPNVGSAAANVCVRHRPTTRSRNPNDTLCRRCLRWSWHRRRHSRPLSRDASNYAPPSYAARRPTRWLSVLSRPRRCQAGPSSESNSRRDLPSTAPRRRRKRSRGPSQLTKVTQILPYLDYEPDPKIAKENPCENQCPTPDGKPCKTRDGRVLGLSEGNLPGGGTVCSREPSLRAFTPGRLPTSVTTRSITRTRSSSGTATRGPSSFSRSSRSVVSPCRPPDCPYQMTLDPPCSAVYPLGYYRPGRMRSEVDLPDSLEPRGGPGGGRCHRGNLLPLPALRLGLRHAHCQMTGRALRPLRAPQTPFSSS